jgi:hypothetical protein
MQARLTVAVLLAGQVGDAGAGRVRIFFGANLAAWTISVGGAGLIRVRFVFKDESQHAFPRLANFVAAAKAAAARRTLLGRAPPMEQRKQGQ